MRTESLGLSGIARARRLPIGRVASGLAFVKQPLDFRGLRHTGHWIKLMRSHRSDKRTNAQHFLEPPLQVFAHLSPVCGLWNLDHHSQLLATAFADTLHDAEEFAVAARVLGHR